MADDLKKHKLQVILIQIDEAHTAAWPMGEFWKNKQLSKIGIKEQAKGHETFAERCERANYFCDTFNPPYPVFIDGWDNQFAELFRAWPDKFHYVDKDLKVIARSEYGREGSKDALIVEDYTVILQNHMAK